MSILQDLRPTKKSLVMDLLKEAGCDVRAWADYGGPPAANPKYCYNWSFEQPGEFVVLCI
jgi:5-methylcytosine-specific restriction protein A